MSEDTRPESYFTAEVEDRIRALSDDQMEILLRELEQTPYWTALLKYIQQRLRFVQTTLFYTDPIKEPGEIARTQGIMLGLSDLQNAIISLKQNTKVDENVTK